MVALIAAVLVRWGQWGRKELRVSQGRWVPLVCKEQQVRGATSPQGLQGPIGATGATGATGLQGLQGPTGPANGLVAYGG